MSESLFGENKWKTNLRFSPGKYEAITNEAVDIVRLVKDSPKTKASFE
jgi:hypothetical protein